MSSPFIRAFFALDLPVEYKRALTGAMDNLKQHLEMLFNPRAFRWVQPQGLHITLQFMAQLHQEDLPSVLQQVREQVRGLKPFYLQIGALEWFPSIYLPHVLSLKTQPHDRLAELSEVIGRGIVAAEYEIENRLFRGHLTIGRVSGLRHVDEECLNVISWPALPEIFVKEIVLFRSETQKGGSAYTRLASIELGGSSD